MILSIVDKVSQAMNRNDLKMTRNMTVNNLTSNRMTRPGTMNKLQSKSPKMKGESTIIMSSIAFQAQKYWKIKCKVPMYPVNYKNLVKIQLNHKKHNNRTEASDNVLMVRHFYA